MQYKNVYMLAMTRKNANVTIALLFMYKVMDILKAYVGSVEVRTEAYLLLSYKLSHRCTRPASKLY